MSQDGFQTRSKRAKIAKTSVFENMCFNMSFERILEHQASQESLKTAKTAPKTAPKMAPGTLQDLSKKNI